MFTYKKCPTAQNLHSVFGKKIAYRKHMKFMYLKIAQKTIVELIRKRLNLLREQAILWFKHHISHSFFITLMY